MNARLFLLSVTVTLASVASAAVLTGVVCGEGEKIPDAYVPPLLANGDISLTLDGSCGMRNREWCGIRPAIYRAGRRGPLPKTELLEEGKLNPVLVIDGVEQSWPSVWRQELDPRQAVTCIDATYDKGVRVTSEAFVCENLPVFAVRRTLQTTGKEPVSVKVGFSFAAPWGERVRGAWQASDFAYTFFGHEVIDGVTRLVVRGVERPVRTTSFGGRVLTLAETIVLKPGEKRMVEAFVVFADSFEEDAAAPAEKVATRAALVEAKGYDGLFADHAAAWAKYWDESYVRIPDAKMQRMYDMAQYDLKCNATRWSFPVGIFPAHWQGKYFAFDEMYPHQGLLTSGHFDLARRCPAFRHSLLKLAKMRCGHYHPDEKHGARWHWESDESGRTECAPVGFWNDHIFQMGTVARSAWTQYLYTDDKAYLKDIGYPVVRECARFFAANWVYDSPDGSAYIGKCTDLERLGPSRDRPFMTTCAAVYAMRSAADAADVLGVDGKEAAAWRKTADRLVAGLPVADGRYLAYVDGHEPTVALLGGLYPFPIFRSDDPLQTAAARHFIANGRAGGNMYPFGKGTCPWYAGKMSIAMSLLGDKVEPFKWLQEASLEQGLFGETYEINEPGHRMHPYFATANGCVVEALNTMLLATIDGKLRIAPGVPAEWKDYAFRLPAPGGIWVEYEVKDGREVKKIVR